MPLDDSHLIVFDGACILCSGFARFMARHDKAGRFRFVTAQSPTGRALYERHQLDPDLMETNIVIVRDEPHVKLAALAAAMRSIGGPWRIFSVLDRIPQPASDWLYDRIARNRYLLGRRQCQIPSAELRGRLVE